MTLTSCSNQSALQKEEREISCIRPNPCGRRIFGVCIVCLLCFSRQDAYTGQEPVVDVTTADFRKAIEYGVCAAMYWGATLFSNNPCAEHFERLDALIGKETKCDVLVCDATNRPRFVYLLLTDLGERQFLPAIQYVLEKKSIGFLEGTVVHRSFVDKCKYVAKDYHIRVPIDWRRIAVQKHRQYESLTKRLAQGVRSYLRQLHPRTQVPQHIFVGPFHEYSGAVYVFWKEQKIVCMVGLSQLEEEMIPLSLLTMYDAGGIDQIDQMHTGIREGCKRWWINTVIGNCVLDGDLICLQ